MSAEQNAWLVRVLDLDPALFDPTAQAAAGGSGGAVAYAKSRLAWLSMRRQVDTAFDGFIDSVAEQYEDEGNDATVRKLLRDRLSPVLATFDDTLADTLDAAANETDVDRRRGLVADARTTIERYQAFVADEQLLAALDDNPFAPTTIRKTMLDTLQTLSASLR